MLVFETHSGLLQWNAPHTPQVASEGPLEGRSGFLIALLKGYQSLFEFAKGFEVIGCKYFLLDNGEINFNLIEPTGMNRGVHEEHVGPLKAEAVDCPLAAMGRAAKPRRLLLGMRTPTLIGRK